jgi:hypothetical protein
LLAVAFGVALLGKPLGVSPLTAGQLKPVFFLGFVKWLSNHFHCVDPLSAHAACKRDENNNCDEADAATSAD